MVARLNGVRYLVTSAFDTPRQFTRVSAFRLPTTNANDAWPMFRNNAKRTGAFEAASSPTQPTEDISAEKCAIFFRFAHDSVPVVKATDGNAVLASVRWEYNAEHQLCYLVLDDAATAVLRANVSVLADAARQEDRVASERCHQAYNPQRGFGRRPVPVVKDS